MMKATIEILYEDEKVLGSPTYGEYMVREYDEDGDEIGGSFYKTIEEAETHVKNYQNTAQDEEEDNS
jgi:hypothetical protein